MPPKASVGRNSGGDDASQLVTLGDWLRYAERRFCRAHLFFGHGTDNPRDEAAWLLLNVVRQLDADLPAELSRVLTAAQRRHARRLIEERVAKRKPLAYLLREAWLGEHRFYVDERVIVPRSHIAVLLRGRLAPWVRSPAQIRSVLDMCTGSGCLAVLLALAFPYAAVDAVDIDASALAVARRNVRAYGLQSRVRLVQSDLFDRLGDNRYDIIIANPPYVDGKAMSRLPPEHRREPRWALAGGRDGLEFVRRILSDAPRHLSGQGALVMEIGSKRRTLERSYPSLPFVWLETGGSADHVLLITRRQILNAA